MVSRGGRSRGCANCRRRRVKCDETRPQCLRCQKRGLDCDGPKEQTWINESGGPKKTTPVSGGQAVTLTPTTQIPLVAFEDDIYLAFTRKTLLRGQAIEAACNLVYYQYNPSTASPALNLLKEGISSLATTFFGSQHNQAAIKSKGYQHYGRVLGQLNNHLVMPSLQTSDETLLTVWTCMLLEIFLPTGPNNFLKHMRGIEVIMEMRGPPSLPFSRTTIGLLQSARALSVIAGLATARSCLFFSEEWKQLPLPIANAYDQLRHDLFTVLADCTRLMQERDESLTSRDERAKTHFIQETKKLLNALDRIRSAWTTQNEQLVGKATSTLAKKLRIANHDSATVHLLYNATFICLLDILDALEPSSHYMGLRMFAATKITSGLEMKISGYSSGIIGSHEASVISFLATKVAWQTLGGLKTAEGRQLAEVVKMAATGVFALGAWEQSPTPTAHTVSPSNPSLTTPTDYRSVQAYGGPGVNARERLLIPREMLDNDHSTSEPEPVVSVTTVLRGDYPLPFASTTLADSCEKMSKDQALDLYEIARLLG